MDIKSRKADAHRCQRGERMLNFDIEDIVTLFAQLQVVVRLLLFLIVYQSEGFLREGGIIFFSSLITKLRPFKQEADLI